MLLYIYIYIYIGVELGSASKGHLALIKFFKKMLRISGKFKKKKKFKIGDLSMTKMKLG